MGNEKCPVCHGEKVNQNAVNGSSQTASEPQILLQRYNQLRSEIMERYEARYKLLQIAIIIAVASLGAIWQLKEFGLAFLGCLFMLCVGIILFAEAHFISIIASYQFQIEKKLDDQFAVSICGWEKYLYALRKEKPLVLRTQTISIVLFIFFFYSLFNALGCIREEEAFEYIIFVVVELVFLIFCFIGYKVGRKFYIPDELVKRTMEETDNLI